MFLLVALTKCSITFLYKIVNEMIVFIRQKLKRKIVNSTLPQSSLMMLFRRYNSICRQIFVGHLQNTIDKENVICPKQFWTVVESIG